MRKKVQIIDQRLSQCLFFEGAGMKWENKRVNTDVSI